MPPAPSSSHVNRKIPCVGDVHMERTEGCRELHATIVRDNIRGGLLRLGIIASAVS
jgi:hypothetical protein